MLLWNTNSLVVICIIFASAPCAPGQGKSKKKLFVNVRIFMLCLCFIQCNPLLISIFLKPPAMLKPILSTAAWAVVSIKGDLWNCYIWNHSQIRESGKSLQPVHIYVKRIIFKEMFVGFFFSSRLRVASAWELILQKFPTTVWCDWGWISDHSCNKEWSFQCLRTSVIWNS